MGIPILIYDKIEFFKKVTKKDQEGHYVMTKGLIQEKSIALINILHPIEEHLNT